MDKPQSHLYHYFIQLSSKVDKLCYQKFAEFQYMQERIKISYKQLKKSKSQRIVKISEKISEKFAEYFKSLQKQEQIKFYSKWLHYYNKAIEIGIDQKKFQEIQNLKKQGQVWIKKSIINKWQKKYIKVENLYFRIAGNRKSKDFPLKFYLIRKSKNKQYLGWVLQIINQDKDSKRNLKSIHCGIKTNIKQFDQWYQFLEKVIDLSKIQYFREGLFNIESCYQKMQKNKKRNQQFHQKTLTQLAIDNQMKIQDQHIQLQMIKDQDEKNKQQTFQTVKCQLNTLAQNENSRKNPNIFKRLYPNMDISTFTQNNNLTLIQSGSGYRLFQKTPYSDEDFRIRINIMLPYKRSLIFKALNQEITLWNNEIQIFSIKTKISSQNSALIYQKNKPQGLLYRQRDYLYFRHCFSDKNNIKQKQKQKDKIFIVDKSIDSISYPPFMTVARGQKKLIYCICGNQSENQSMLIVQGQIKGGGYMNVQNDKQMTIKFFKKLLSLQTYLNEKKFMTGNNSSKIQTVFKQNWIVQEQQEQFYDIQKTQDKNDEVQSQQSEQQNNKSQQKRKFSSTSDQDYNQFEEFIKKTSQQNLHQQQQGQLTKSQIQAQSDQIFKYTPPKIAQDNTVIIPLKYLKSFHHMTPFEKSSHPSLFPHIRGHHLFKGQWAICPTGGLNYIDEQKMNQQKKVLTFIIKRIGKNILSGKGVLNISLPVDIFCRQSNIQRQAASFGFGPIFLQKAAKLQDPSQQLKQIMGFTFFGSLIYLTMEKPFNPILGQTYQSWMDGCPIYFQQISHHPPIAAYLMIGRGYRLSGTLEAKMDLSINSGTGINQGIFKVEFDNGRKFYYTTSAGQISGLTYGERKLLMVGKSFYWNVEQGLFLQVQFNPISKNKWFFSGSSSSIITNPDAHLHDYFEGTLKKYKKQDLEEFLRPKKGDYRKIMAIPKGSPSVSPLSQIYNVSGRWTKYLSFNNQKLFDIDECRYFTMKDQDNPLPSHSNFRQDVVYRRLNKCVMAQEFKEVLEVKQRKDRKLRETHGKK